MATEFSTSATHHVDTKSNIVTSEAQFTSLDDSDGLFPKIPGFKGDQFPLAQDGEELRAYTAANKLYASSSHEKDHNMRPGLIIRPTGDEDIKLAIKYAVDKKLKISIKSGGHQYSGACSTQAPNIMMDLGKTYESSDDLRTYIADNKTMLKVSVSQALRDVNKFLGNNKLFMPHGQCAYVHIGGHGQTGGYGNLGRSFGLFGDHIRKIRLFDHSATLKEISLDSPSQSDRDLFSAILGGSPGNFGVITHYHVQVHRDADHEFGNVRPYFYRGLHLYTRGALQNCLQKVAEMADNPDFPRNYDLCVSVLSQTFKLARLGGPDAIEEILSLGSGPKIDLVSNTKVSLGTDDGLMIEQDVNVHIEEAEKGNWPRVIAIYAQWIPFSKDDKIDHKWFDYFYNQPWRLNIPGARSLRAQGPVSQIMSLWLFVYPREFDFPYDKRTYMTKSTNLTKSGWAAMAADRIDLIVNPFSRDQDLFKNCYLAVQIQPYGGKDSRFYTNRNNGTSYSWRDSTVCQILDCFYSNKASAERWQKENDRIMKGKGSVYSEDDRRVLWGSYGDWDMSKSWQFYYENETKYKKLGRVRGVADPKGTFTANPFAVEAIPPAKDK